MPEVAATALKLSYRHGIRHLGERQREKGGLGIGVKNGFCFFFFNPPVFSRRKERKTGGPPKKK
ncbi:MAG: hypothetical protein ACC628_16000, partial [Pirellulaceae bacterium]